MRMETKLKSIKNHEGSVVSRGNTVEIVFMSSNENSIISDPKPSNSPLIYKLSADYQKDLLQNLDEIAILRIATLSGIVSPSEIKGILGLVADEKKQKLSHLFLLYKKPSIKI